MRKRGAPDAALAPVRPGRQRPQAREGPRGRRRRAHRRPRGFGRARRQGDGAPRHRATSCARRAARPDRPRLFVRVNGLATGLDRRRSRRRHGGRRRTASCCRRRSAAPTCPHLGAKLAVREAEFGLDGRRARAIVAIATETARGLFALGTSPGASHRLRASPGAARTCRPISARRPTACEDGTYTEPYRLARSLTLFGAAAAEVDAIDAVYTNFRDDDGPRGRMPRPPPRRLRRQDGDPPGAGAGHQRGLHALAGGARPGPGGRRGLRARCRAPASSASTARCSTGRTSRAERAAKRQLLSARVRPKRASSTSACLRGRVTGRTC